MKRSTVSGDTDMTARSIFSKDYRTFQDWLKAHPENTSYNRRIIGEHKKHPRANLSQLRGHPGKKRKPVSKLKPKKERKKPKKMEIVVSGNAVTDDRSNTAKNVYAEVYIKSTRDEDKVADDILKYLKDKGIKVFPVEQDENIKAVTVNFRENVPKGGGKVISQKKAKEFIYHEIDKEMQPAKPKKKGDRTREYQKRKEKRMKEREEKKRRYDDNGF